MRSLLPVRLHSRCKPTTASRHFQSVGPTQCMAAAGDAACCTLLQMADAHCHPQDDPSHLSLVAGVTAQRLAVMGTRGRDWEAVERLYLAYPDKVIPCFGVHPWFAHEHALAPGTRGQDVVELPAKQGSPHTDEQTRAVLDSELDAAWQGRLRELLLRYPRALVGEFGLDRAAVIRGTKLHVSYSHQLQLTEMQLRLAAELQRPVSLHCVRAYGHLRDMFDRLGPEQCPPRIMLHSFGGTPETVAQFTKGLPRVGSRIYFSFSTTISGNNREKLIQRIKAVPDERFLLESDHNTPTQIDASLDEILDVVTQAKGWDRQHAAQQAMANFDAFFATEGQG